MLQASKSSVTAKAIWVKTGEVTTGLAMVAQGLLAGLMGDQLIREKFSDPNPVARGVAFIALSFTAFEAKRRLVTYFNTSSFENISKIELKKFFKDLSRDYLRIFNYIWSIIPSLSFSYLTEFALLGSADFLRGYDIKLLNIIAAILEHCTTIIFLEIASFISNFFSFPGIHERGLTFLKDMLKSLFSSNTSLKAELKAESQFNTGINPLIIEFNQYVKTNKVELLNSSVTEKSHLLNAINANDTHNANKAALLEDELRKKLNAFKSIDGVTLTFSELLSQLNDLSDAELVRCFSESTKIETGSHWKIRASTTLSLIATSYVAIGLSNFIGIGKNMAVDFLNLENRGKIAVIFGIAAMISMCAMAMHVGKDIKKLIENNRTHLKILNQNLTLAILVSSILICALGGAPNAYQSYVITSQSLFYVIAAAIASFALEIGGFYRLTSGKSESKKLIELKNHNPEIIQLHDLLDRLENIDVKQTLVKSPATYRNSEKKAFSWLSCFYSEHDPKLSEPMPAPVDSSKNCEYD